MDGYINSITNLPKRKEKVSYVTVFTLELQFLGVNVMVFPLKRNKPPETKVVCFSAVYLLLILS